MIGISGGPLLNEEGEVIGIQSSHLKEYRGSLASLSFAFGVKIENILKKIFAQTQSGNSLN